MKICIIIVNWNSGELLKNAVYSILKSNIKGNQVKIIIVDNASTDQSLYLIPKQDNIYIIKNNENLGFGAACNQGFKSCDYCDFVLLLNPDVELFPNTLYDSIFFLSNDLSKDILGVRHLDERGMTKPSCSRFINPLTLTFSSIGLPKLFPKLFHNASIMIEWNHGNSCYVNQVMGAFMLIKRDVIDNIGFMDENFFVYFEDMDFCKRASENNYSVFYNADIKIFHKGMGTTESVKDKRLFYSIDSRLKYMKKYFPFFIYLYSIFISITFEPLFRCVYLLVKLDFKCIRETISAYTMLYKKLYFKNENIIFTKIR